MPVKTARQWLDEYGESHRNPVNKLLHWICVPIIVLSLIAMLWSVPVPQGVREFSPLLNWGTLLLAAGLVYYLVLSAPLAAGMAVFVAVVMSLVVSLQQLPWPLWQVALVLFVVAWIGQFIGHHYEGKRPSFFKDLQFLLIGPLWLMSFVYQKLRIRY